MQAPVFIKDIPLQAIHERASYGPVSLLDFMQVAEEDKPSLQFRAELSSGESLPRGLICMSDGILTGIPARETHGDYEVRVTVENEAGTAEAIFPLRIKQMFVAGEGGYLDEVKAKIWEAIGKNLALPSLEELETLYNQPISSNEVYYLLERWATIQIYNAFDFDPGGEKKLLQLKGASPHYVVYDRGSYLVAVPKDLFSHEHTLEDGLQTARALAREAYSREWTMELRGFDKLKRAAWVEIQHLIDKHGKALDVINYQPNSNDVKIYKRDIERSYEVTYEQS